MNKYHRCACRIVKDWQNSETPHRLVILAPEEGLDDVRNAVSVLGDPGESLGDVRRFSDIPPSDDFYLAVCNGGQKLEKQNVEEVALWRKAARKCGLFF